MNADLEWNALEVISETLGIDDVEQLIRNLATMRAFFTPSD